MLHQARPAAQHAARSAAARLHPRARATPGHDPAGPVRAHRPDRAVRAAGAAWTSSFSASTVSRWRPRRWPRCIALCCATALRWRSRSSGLASASASRSIWRCCAKWRASPPRTRHIGARYGLVQMVRELELSLNQELDFRLEAENTRLIGRQIADFAKLCTPTVYLEYTSQRVLTLSFITRPPPGRRVAARSSRSSTRRRIANDLLSAYMKQIAIDGVFHCDPHPGNILLTDDGRLALMDFGMVGRFDAGQKDKMILFLLAFSERLGERVAETYLDMIEQPEGPRPARLHPGHLRAGQSLPRHERWSARAGFGAAGPHAAGVSEPGAGTHVDDAAGQDHAQPRRRDQRAVARAGPGRADPQLHARRDDEARRRSAVAGTRVRLGARYEAPVRELAAADRHDPRQAGRRSADHASGRRAPGADDAIAQSRGYATGRGRARWLAADWWRTVCCRRSFGPVRLGADATGNSEGLHFLRHRGR